MVLHPSSFFGNSSPDFEENFSIFNRRKLLLPADGATLKAVVRNDAESKQEIDITVFNISETNCTVCINLNFNVASM
jgi:hypothetical protein